MPKFLQDINLKAFNTFGLDANASFFTSFESVEALKEILNTEIFKSQKRLIIGGGSNILLTADFDGLVLKLFFQMFNN